MSTIRALLDATPPPPEDVDVDTLTTTFAAVSAARQAIIDSLTAPILVDDADRPLLATLRARQDAWHAALSRALDHVRDQRIAATKVKGYAAGL